MASKSAAKSKTKHPAPAKKPAPKPAAKPVAAKPARRKADGQARAGRRQARDASRHGKAAVSNVEAIKAVAIKTAAKGAARSRAADKDAAETTDSPLLDLSDAAVRKMIKLAKKRGYVTYEQINAVLPSEEVTSEQIEDMLAMLNEMGINVVEYEEAERGRGEREEDDDDDEAGGDLVEVSQKSVAETKKSEPGERTDDPVRMYLREMGSVELLSREGEIAIAKRIEAGREAMIAGLCESPLTFQAIIIWRDELNEGKVFLRDIIDLEATYAGPDAVKGMADRRAGRRRRSGPPRRPRGGAPAGPADGRRAAVGAAGRDPVPSGARRRSFRQPQRRRQWRRRGRGRARARRPASRPGRRRHGEFAVARRDRGRAEAEGAGDLRQGRQRLQAAAPPAGPGHREPAAERVALARAGAQVQEDQGRADRRGEVAAAQPGAHRRAGRAALRHQQAARVATKAA